MGSLDMAILAKRQKANGRGNAGFDVKGKDLRTFTSSSTNPSKSSDNPCLRTETQGLENDTSHTFPSQQEAEGGVHKCSAAPDGDGER